MKFQLTLKAVFLAVCVGPHMADAQDVRLQPDDMGRQCAIPGTDLHAYLQTALPDCSKYCRVERDPTEVTAENLDTMIFGCADEDGAVVPPPNEGLRAAAALGVIGLILISIGDGDGGSTSDTQ